MTFMTPRYPIHWRHHRFAKGVMLSHYNLLANLTQIPSHLPPMLYQQGNNVVLTALPLYHIFSLMVSWVTLQQGGQNLGHQP